jgi:uncharacterized membrane protein
MGDRRGWINPHIDSAMIDRLLPALTFMASLCCGLAAGIFFAFSSLVMRALARIPSPAGIAAMQSINVSVVNLSFCGAFFGPALICCVLAVCLLFKWNSPGAHFILLGCALYLVGTMFVTFAFNVPLNDALATLDPASAESATQWASYLTTWTNWNHVRTLSALFAPASFNMAFCSAH